MPIIRRKSQKTFLYSLFQQAILLSPLNKAWLFICNTHHSYLHKDRMKHTMNFLIWRKLLIEKEPTSRLRASRRDYEPDDGQGLSNYCLQLHLISVPHSLRCNNGLYNTNYSSFWLRQTRALCSVRVCTIYRKDWQARMTIQQRTRVTNRRGKWQLCTALRPRLQVFAFGLPILAEVSNSLAVSACSLMHWQFPSTNFLMDSSSFTYGSSTDYRNELIPSKIRSQSISYTISFIHFHILRNLKQYYAHHTNSPFIPILNHNIKTKTPWSESASELYRPSDHRLSAKWLPTFADRGCHVVSVTDPYGRILGF
jgi:sulfur relay (sulfurtransferase) DsrC/TusE family protein